LPGEKAHPEAFALKGGRKLVPVRQWDPAYKARIVLEGLQGKPETAICKRHRIKPAEYRRWRKRFLARIGKTVQELFSHAPEVAWPRFPAGSSR